MTRKLKIKYLLIYNFYTGHLTMGTSQLKVKNVDSNR